MILYFMMLRAKLASKQLEQCAYGSNTTTDQIHISKTFGICHVPQLVHMLQCVLDECKKQEDQGDKCVAEASLTEAKDYLKIEIAKWSK